jgi:hypothetical protein
MVVRKRIRNINCTFVSLLKRGANRAPALLKDETDGITLTALTKASSNGELHVLVYVPDHDDAHGHYMTKADVRQACHTHAQNGGTLDLRHDCKPLSKAQAVVVENMILTKQDDRFAQADRDGKPIKHDGAWAQIIKIHDPELLKQAEAGELAEVSLYAPAGGYELVDDAPGPAAKTETPKTMDPEQMKAFMEGLAKAFEKQTEALTKALTPKAPEKVEAPKDELPYEMDSAKGPILKSNIGSLTRTERLGYLRAREDWSLTKAYEAAGTDSEALAKCEAAETALEKKRGTENATFRLDGSVDSLIGALGLNVESTAPLGKSKGFTAEDEDSLVKELDALQKTLTTVKEA